MSIADWPADERPREKLLQRGSNALSDAELLAIFLRTGIKGKSAVDLARDLLSDFGSLRELMRAPQEHFCQHMGLGPAKFAQLQAVLEMAKRHLYEELERGNVLENPTATKNYLASQLRPYKHEVFAGLFLDNRHRVIQFEELFTGTIDGASVYPREVVKKAMGYNAAAIIFAHNHPSGVSEPSQADRNITHRLRDALELVDVRVLDHIIVGDELISFAEKGYL